MPRTRQRRPAALSASGPRGEQRRRRVCPGRRPAGRRASPRAASSSRCSTASRRAPSAEHMVGPRPRASPPAHMGRAPCGLGTLRRFARARDRSHARCPGRAGSAAGPSRPSRARQAPRRAAPSCAEAGPRRRRAQEFSEWAQCQVLEAVSGYQPSGEQEVFDVMNALDDRLAHSNSAVVMATVKLFLHLTLTMPATHQQARPGRPAAGAPPSTSTSRHQGVVRAVSWGCGARRRSATGAVESFPHSVVVHMLASLLSARGERPPGRLRPGAGARARVTRRGAAGAGAHQGAAADADVARPLRDRVRGARALPAARAARAQPLLPGAAPGLPAPAPAGARRRARAAGCATLELCPRPSLWRCSGATHGAGCEVQGRVGVGQGIAHAA
jgi:hypothetical protein